MPYRGGGGRGKPTSQTPDTARTRSRPKLCASRNRGHHFRLAIAMGLDTCTRDASGGTPLDAQDGEELVRGDMGVSLHCDSQAGEQGKLFVTNRCVHTQVQRPTKSARTADTQLTLLAAAPQRAGGCSGSAMRTPQKASVYLSAR